VATDTGLAPTAFDPEALQGAVDALGEALAALDTQDKQARAASRSAIREKARTGRLKPMRAVPVASPTGPVAEEFVGIGTGTLPFDALEHLVSAAIEAETTGKESPQ
jgi:hypothetical protein